MKRISNEYKTERLGKGTNGRTQLKMTITDGNGKEKVIYGEALDSDQDFKDMEEFNKDMEDVRRDFIIKNAMSERSAAEIILTH